MIERGGGSSFSDEGKKVIQVGSRETEGSFFVVAFLE